MSRHEQPLEVGKIMPGYFAFFAKGKDGSKVWHYFDGEFTTYVSVNKDNYVTTILKKLGEAPIIAPTAP